MKIRPLVLVLFAAGCSQTQVLKPQEFYSPTTQSSAEQPVVKIDSASAPLYDQVKTDKPRTLGNLGGISPEVNSVIQRPELSQRDGAVTSRPTGITTGQYMTIGGVVSEVNGTPIFANKVLKALEPLLAARAKELDYKQYQQVAEQLILKQIKEFERAELEYAAADRILDSDDKHLSDALTVQWRSRQITDGGGSLELIKKKYVADGKNFDDEVKEQYRMFLTRIYYEKKVIPRIQISVSDMRDYYQKNLETQFTEHGEATFRLIKIDPREIGGKDKAIARAKDLFDRANAGQDFSELAGSFNREPLLQKAKGLVGPIQRGAYKLEKVETAIWKLQPAQVSDIIDETDGCYYIAKLETLKKGRILAFEDQALQKSIRDNLRADQLRVLREQVQQNLLKNAVVRDDPQMMNSALEMALQRYAMR